MRSSLEVLAYIHDNPGRGPSAIALALGGTNSRAVQRILARARESTPPLVRAEGDGPDRAYYLTSDGVAWLTTERAARAAVTPRRNGVPIAPAGDTPDRAALRRVSAALTEAGVPATEADGTPIAPEDRVRLLAEERDSVDSSLDEAIRGRVRSAYEEDPRLRALAGVLPPDEMLRVVVEAGLTALTGRPTAHRS
jgi:hypothetical protein